MVKLGYELILWDDWWDEPDIQEEFPSLHKRLTLSPIPEIYRGDYPTCTDNTFDLASIYYDMELYAHYFYKPTEPIERITLWLRY